MKLTYLRDAGDAASLLAWARKLIEDLNRSSDPLAMLPGPYANDVSAANAGIAIGLGYVDSEGVARRRMA